LVEGNSGYLSNLSIFHSLIRLLHYGQKKKKCPTLGSKAADLVEGNLGYLSTAVHHAHPSTLPLLKLKFKWVSSVRGK